MQAIMDKISFILIGGNRSAFTLKLMFKGETPKIGSDMLGILLSYE